MLFIYNTDITPPKKVVHTIKPDPKRLVTPLAIPIFNDNCSTISANS